MALQPAHISVHAQMPRVLMLTHRVPYPPDRGDRIRSWNLLRFLANYCEVSLACVSDEPVTDEQRDVLRQVASHVLIERIGRVGSGVRGVASLVRGGAVTPAMLYRRSLSRKVVRWQGHMPFDAVLTFCSGMIRYADDVMRAAPPPPEAKPRHVLDLVDVDSMKWARFAASSRRPMRWVYAAESRRLARVERGDIASPDAVTVISDDEAKLYRHEVAFDAPLHVVGNGVDTRWLRPLADAPAPAISFIGVLDYRPNIDGAAWFAREVLPLIRERVPNATFRIVGRRPTREVLALGELPGITVVGSVPDVRDELAKARCVVAPLLIAPGVQNKVLEAMACRRAVVCTPGAAAGIDADANTHYLSADQPAAFAHQVVRVLTDGALRNRLAANARRRMEEWYAWDERLAPMLGLLLPKYVRALREAA